MVITERAYSGRRYHTTGFSKSLKKMWIFWVFWHDGAQCRLGANPFLCEEHLNLYLHKKCANDGMCVLRKQRNF